MNLKSVVDGFVFAFSYFSILPLKKEISFNIDTYKYTLFFFPFVGIILGFCTLGFFFLINQFFIFFYAAVLSSCFYLILYGFLHLEAFSDVIDGYLASFTNKDVYLIMKEPQVGSIGAIGTFVFILTKISSIIYLLYLHKYELFILSLTFSRLLALNSFYLFNFHAKSSFLHLLKSSLSLKFLIFSMIFYIFLFIYFVNIKDILLFFIFSFFIIIFTLKFLQKRFGFLNGDCIGFSIEKNEFFLLNLGILL